VPPPSVDTGGMWHTGHGKREWGLGRRSKQPDLNIHWAEWLVLKKAGGLIGASLARITSECTCTSLSEQLIEHARRRARENAEGERAKDRVTTRQAHTYIDSDVS